MGPDGEWCLSDPGYELNGNDSTNGVWKDLENTLSQTLMILQELVANFMKKEK